LLFLAGIHGSRQRGLGVVIWTKQRFQAPTGSFSVVDRVFKDLLTGGYG